MLSRILEECTSPLDYGRLDEALGGEASAELLVERIAGCVEEKLPEGLRVSLAAACTMRGTCAYVRSSAEVEALIGAWRSPPGG